EDARKQARRLRSLASRAMDEIGNLARGLHPAALDDLGLSVALSRLLSDFEKIHGLRITLKSGCVRTDQLPAVVQIGIYRIVQEALTNVARHARANSVEVRFNLLPHEIEITIADDGYGFDASLPAESGTHLGLQSMRERAALLGGNLEIVSEPQGTQVVARIPTEAGNMPAKVSEQSGKAKGRHKNPRTGR